MAKNKANNLPELLEAITNEIEWLETSTGDEVECISIENLEGFLTNYFNKPIKLSQE